MRKILFYMLVNHGKEYSFVILFLSLLVTFHDLKLMTIKFRETTIFT